MASRVEEPFGPYSVFGVGSEAASSSEFRGELERLRRLGREPHTRSTGTLASLSWAQLDAARAERIDPRRPAARRSDEERGLAVDSEPGDAQLERYMRRCANVARRYLCSGAAAPVVHSLARGVLPLDVLLAIDARRGREPRAAVLAADLLVTPSSRAATGTSRASIRGLAVAAEGSSGHRFGFPTG